MSTSLMSVSHPTASSPWAVPMARGEVQRIAPADHARWLAVSDGTLSVTTLGDAQRDGTDIWLDAGQSVQVGAGVEALVEARSPAAFQLAEALAAPVSHGAGAWQRLARWAERERQLTQLGAVFQPCLG